jgi:hypothetical protein
MSNQIEIARVNVYSSGIQMLAQQMTSVLRGAIGRTHTVNNKKISIDQVGKQSLKPRASRHADMPISETPQSRVWISSAYWDGGDYIDERDKLQVLNDPTNSYTMAFGAAAARRFDKAVVDGMLGNMIVGEEGTGLEALPASQIIVDGATGLTFAKLKQGVRILRGANALMPGDVVNIGATAKQEEEFINTAEVKSSDFTTKRIIDAGGVNEFYRVQFHYLEDVEDNDDGRILPKVGTVRSLPMWVKSGVEINERMPATGILDWDPRKQAWLVGSKIDVGGTRTQHVKVVRIDVQEA